MCGCAAAEGPLPLLSVYPDALGQDWTLIFGDMSRLTFRITLRPHPNGPVAQLFLFGSDTEKLK